MTDPQEIQFEECCLALNEMDDPLQIFCSHFQYLQEKDPPVSQTRFNVISERATHEFKDDPRYQNDPRFLKLWITYANGVDRPHDVYEYMRQKGIASRLSSFYNQYATYLESINQYQQAFQVLTDGIRNNAQPLLKLTKRLTEFSQVNGTKLVRDVGDETVISNYNDPSDANANNQSLDTNLNQRNPTTDFTFSSIICQPHDETSHPQTINDESPLNDSYVIKKKLDSIQEASLNQSKVKIEIKAYKTEYANVQFEQVRADFYLKSLSPISSAPNSSILVESNMLSSLPANNALNLGDGGPLDFNLNTNQDEMTKNIIYQDNTTDLRAYSLALAKRKQSDTLTLDGIAPFMFHCLEGTNQAQVTMLDHLCSTVKDVTMTGDQLVQHVQHYGPDGAKMNEDAISTLAAHGIILDEHHNIVKVSQPSSVIESTPNVTTDNSRVTEDTLASTSYLDSCEFTKASSSTKKTITNAHTLNEEDLALPRLLDSPCIGNVQFCIEETIISKAICSSPLGRHMNFDPSFPTDTVSPQKQCSNPLVVDLDLDSASNSAKDSPPHKHDSDLENFKQIYKTSNVNSVSVDLTNNIKVDNMTTTKYSDNNTQVEADSLSCEKNLDTTPKINITNVDQNIYENPPKKKLRSPTTSPRESYFPPTDRKVLDSITFEPPVLYDWSLSKKLPSNNSVKNDTISSISLCGRNIIFDELSIISKNRLFQIVDLDDNVGPQSENNLLVLKLSANSDARSMIREQIASCLLENLTSFGPNPSNSFFTLFTNKAKSDDEFSAARSMYFHPYGSVSQRLPLLDEPLRILILYDIIKTIISLRSFGITHGGINSSHVLLVLGNDLPSLKTFDKFSNWASKRKSPFVVIVSPKNLSSKYPLEVCASKIDELTSDYTKSTPIPTDPFIFKNLDEISDFIINNAGKLTPLTIRQLLPDDNLSSNIKTNVNNITPEDHTVSLSPNDADIRGLSDLIREMLPINSGSFGDRLLQLAADENLSEASSMIVEYFDTQGYCSPTSTTDSIRSRLSSLELRILEK